MVAGRMSNFIGSFFVEKNKSTSSSMILKILTLFIINVCNSNNNNALMLKFDLRNINSWCIDIKKSINNKKKK